MWETLNTVVFWVLLACIFGVGYIGAYGPGYKDKNQDGPSAFHKGP